MQADHESALAGGFAMPDALSRAEARNIALEEGVGDIRRDFFEAEAFGADWAALRGRHERYVRDHIEVYEPPHTFEPAFEPNKLGKIDEAQYALRRDIARWSRWTGPLILLPSRDANAAYLRMLANTQILLAPRFEQPDALAPFWQRICREAGVFNTAGRTALRRVA